MKDCKDTNDLMNLKDLVTGRSTAYKLLPVPQNGPTI
jgi:hypothetical protein